MMKVRYMYSFDDKVSYGYYECDVEDFKKLWKKIKNECYWCHVEIWDETRKFWGVCDCWVYYKIWKENGWYKNGWQFLSGID